MASSWLRIIFEKEGSVDDVFISKKFRKFRNEAFDFVTFRGLQDARNAIKNLNGFAVRGMKLRVSVAR